MRTERSEPLSTEESAVKKRPSHWRKFIAESMVATIATSMGILGIDTERSKALDTPDEPTTSVFDPNIAGAKDPESEARVRSVNPELIKQCRRSEFIVIYLSGAGMETSHYAASVFHQLVEELGGCSVYHWYGHVYDAKATTESIVHVIEYLANEGEKKKTVLIGPSTGGIIAEDIATQPALQNSNSIDLRKIIMVQTPVDMNDTTEKVFGFPVHWLQQLPIPEFGGLIPLAHAINGQIIKKGNSSSDEWRDTFLNAKKTRPALLHSQLERIQQGLRKVNPNVAVDYIASPDGDHTVNNLQAYQRLIVLLGEDKVTYVVVSGVGHDELWISEKAEKFKPAIKNALKGLPDKAD